jgi:hypothetical protein
MAEPRAWLRQSLMLHTFAGFVADFPVRVDGMEPAGRELANFIHDALANAGLCPSRPEDNGWAWVLFTKDGFLEAQTIIGLIDDVQATPPRQWLITNDYRLPLYRRLLHTRNSRERQQTLLHRVCVAIHDAMGLDARFASVLWYRADTFDKPGDMPSTQPDVP